MYYFANKIFNDKNYKVTANETIPAKS